MEHGNNTSLDPVAPPQRATAWAVVLVTIVMGLSALGAWAILTLMGS